MNFIGTIVFEKKPVEGSRRNSEGAFLDLKDGRIMHAYSHFIGGADWDDCNLAACYSDDDGRTWYGEDILVTMADDGLTHDPKNPQNIMEISLMRMRNSDIGLFYEIRRTLLDTRLVLRRSSDEGKTWSGPVICSTSIGYHCICHDRVIRLSNGRILAPDSIFRIRLDDLDFTDPTAPEKAWDGYGDCIFHVSDDDGLTWCETPGRIKLAVPATNNGLQEPMVIELKNGVLWCLSRTDLGRQYESYSMNRGETWTAPQPSRFTSPLSPMVIKRVAKTDSLIAVWNPVPVTISENYKANKWWQVYPKRSPLVAAISRDDGQIWEDFKYLDGNEPDLPGQFSYPALHILKDAFLVSYMDQMRGGISMKIKRVEFAEL